MIARAKRLLARLQASPPGRLAVKFAADNAPNQAVLIAWNMLGSIFPIALFLAAVLGFALRFFGLHEDAVYRNVFAVLPADQQASFVQGVQGVKQSSGLFFAVGLAGLLWSASSLFGTMEQAFDLIFHAPRRPFVKQKLMAVGMMALFAVLAGLAVASSSLLPLLSQLPAVPPSLSQGFGKFVLQPVIGILAGILLFGTIYYVVPNRRQRLSQVWPGALLAGVAFEALALAFPLYIGVEKGMNQYGKAFALMFVLLAYFYFLGLITMVGAELNALLYPVPIEPDASPQVAPARARRAPAAPDRPARMKLPKRVLYGAVGAVIGLSPGLRRRRPT